MELTEAEQEMIELLRKDRHITLTIHQDGGQWHIGPALFISGRWNRL